MNFIKKFKEYNSNVKWSVFTCVVLMTMGSWLDINGIWCELPIMVHNLPEFWRLPSIISFCMQLAQIAPWTFLLFKFLYPNRVSYVLVIYIILGIGALSCFLLAFFWKTTVFIAGDQRSLGLYILTLTLGLLDGTSSVTFLPFIGSNFKQEYIIPIYIGESLSAMIPSVLGLIQGVGKDPGCRNVTNDKNETNLYPIPLEPNYSVSVYYIFMFILLSISTFSFSLLNFSSWSKTERKKVDESDEQKKDRDDKQVETSLAEKCLLLFYVLVISTIVFGVLPSLQSYSTLPYGKSTYHLSTDLSYFFLPFVTFFSIWSYQVSTWRITLELLMAFSCSTYIIVVSCLSPCPPLLASSFGSFLIILCWILLQCLFMRSRLVIASRLQSSGQKFLLLFGAFTLIGQLIGGTSLFLSVNVFHSFKDAPACTNIIELCKAN